MTIKLVMFKSIMIAAKMFPLSNVPTWTVCPFSRKPFPFRNGNHRFYEALAAVAIVTPITMPSSFWRNNNSSHKLLLMTIRDKIHWLIEVEEHKDGKE